MGFDPLIARARPFDVEMDDPNILYAVMAFSIRLGRANCWDYWCPKMVYIWLVTVPGLVVYLKKGIHIVGAEKSWQFKVTIHK